MPKRTDIRSIIIGLTAALLATSASAEVTRPDDGPPGFYSVGPWEGRCVRDGWLNGSDHESCGAELLTPGNDLYLARTVKGLTITLDSTACKKMVFKATMTKAQLARPDRSVQLETKIKGLMKTEAKKCGANGSAAIAINRNDLTDILNETDGLEF